MITNRNNFPEALVKAVENDTYSKGDSDYSVTELLKPPRQSALQIINKNLLSDDVEDRLWSLYGQIVHTILERAYEHDLAEKRFSVMIAGKKVSAQVDTLSHKDDYLSDYKFTTSYKFKVGSPPDPEWVAQLNMQAYILRKNGYTVKAARIVGLLRDWSKLEAQRTEDYPKKGVIIVPIPLWSDAQVEAFMTERIALHEAARAGALPDCNQSERWAKPDQWAVMKGERAIRFGVCLSEASAKEMHAKNAGTRIEFRPGLSMRCEQYCNVKDYCTQYMKIQAQKRST